MSTFNQFKDSYFGNCRYGEKYRQNKTLYVNKCKELKQDWVKYLLEHAQIEVFPHWVCQDFIRQFGEKALFGTFRGIYAKGISKFRI